MGNLVFIIVIISVVLQVVAEQKKKQQKQPRSQHDPSLRQAQSGRQTQPYRQPVQQSRQVQPHRQPVQPRQAQPYQQPVQQPKEEINDIFRRATAAADKMDDDELKKEQTNALQEMEAAPIEINDTVTLGAPSELMQEVNGLILMGYQSNLTFDRDFVSEGIEMLNNYEISVTK